MMPDIEQVLNKNCLLPSLVDGIMEVSIVLFVQYF
jgi:hypothetical protein